MREHRDYALHLRTIFGKREEVLPCGVADLKRVLGCGAATYVRLDEREELVEPLRPGRWIEAAVVLRIGGGWMK